MEKEIIETYRFDPNEFTDGVKEDGTTFREVVADFERRERLFVLKRMEILMTY